MDNAIIWHLYKALRMLISSRTISVKLKTIQTLNNKPTIWNYESFQPVSKKKKKKIPEGRPRMSDVSPLSGPGSAWILSPLFSPLFGRTQRQRRGHRLRLEGLSEAVCFFHLMLSCSASLLRSRSTDSYLQQAANQLLLYLPPSTLQKRTTLPIPCFSINFPTSLNTLTVCPAKHF